MRRRSILLLVGLGLGWLILATHQSDRTTVLSRYSPAYAAMLALYAAGLALLATRLSRVSAWMERLGGRLVELSRVSPGAVADTSFGRLVGLTCLLHATLVCVFLSPRLVFSSRPILFQDYAHHFNQVETFIATMSAGFRHWGYDPTFCAGYPVGTLFDVDMKLFEVVAYALTRIGLSPGLAFNLVIFCFFLSVPGILLWSSKNFGFTRGSTLLTVFSGVLLWSSESMLVRMNRSGLCSFVFGTYLALLALSFFDRFLRDGRTSSWVLLTVSLCVGLMAHILVPFILAVAMLSLYAGALGRITRRQHALAIAAVVIALVANSWWMLTILRFLPFRVATTFGAPGRLTDTLVSMILNAQPPLVLALLGIWGFYYGRRRHPSIMAMGTLSIVWFFFLTYLLEGVPVLRTLEPARFRIPMVVFGAVGFSLGLSTVYEERKLSELTFRAAFPWALMASYFLETVSLPRTALQRGIVDQTKVVAPLIGWIHRHTSTEARIALMDESPYFFSATMVHHFARRHYIGGPFTQMNLSHIYAALTNERFFGERISQVTTDDVRAHADLFNIGWIVAATEESCARFGGMHDVLKPMRRFTLRHPDGELPVCTFEVDRAPSYFLRGSGRAEASLNQIAVHGASPGGVVLKFHWMDGFAVDPPMPIRKHPVPGSPIGFIEVDNGGTTDFVIRNAYRAR